MRLKQIVREETDAVYARSVSREDSVVPSTDVTETLALRHAAGVDSRHAVSATQGGKQAVCSSLTVLLNVLSGTALTGFAFLCCLYLAFEMPVPLSVLRITVGAFSIGSL